jgi:hypothetical protein
MAPAVAPRGLPVMAIQCVPCSGGFCVVRGGSESWLARACWAGTVELLASTTIARVRNTRAYDMVRSFTGAPST